MIIYGSMKIAPLVKIVLICVQVQCVFSLSGSSVAARWTFNWTTGDFPHCVPCRGVPDRPLAGNGDLGMVIGGNLGALGPPMLSKSSFSPSGLGLYFGKNDFWGWPAAVTYHASFQHFSPGFLLLSLLDSGEPIGQSPMHHFTATQRIVDATLTASVSNISSGHSIEIRAMVLFDRNVAEVNVTVKCPPGVQSARLNLTLGSDNVFEMPLQISDPGTFPLTLTKASVHDGGFVDLLLTPCNPQQIVYNGLRTFLVDPHTRRLTVANGTQRKLCLRLLDEAAGRVVTAPCGPDASWAFDGASGEIRAGADVCLGVQDHGPQVACPKSSWYTDPSANGACQSMRWTVAAFSCAGPLLPNVSTRWEFDVETSFMRASAAGRCLTSVGPLASNNAAVVVAIHGGRPVTGPAGVGQGQGLLDVSCGAAVPLTIGVATERDAGFQAAVSPLSLARALASADRHDRAAHAEWWRAFYDRSAVDLDGGAGGEWAALEEYYCAMVYLLGCSMRPGRVAPSLWGPFSTTDFPQWSDARTLDYNFQAAFWGAAGSNRPDLLGLYADAVFDSRLVPLAALRAAQPDWSVGGWPDRAGAEVMGMGCGPAAGWDRSGGCPPGTGGYAGLAFVSCAGPFWGMECAFDDGTRFVAGLAATPLLQYYDATQDCGFLARRLLPFLAGVAAFYASYAEWNATAGSFDLPFTCAQELCASGLRPARAERNGHQDLAYARMALGRLLELTDPGGGPAAA